MKHRLLGSLAGAVAAAIVVSIAAVVYLALTTPAGGRGEAFFGALTFTSESVPGGFDVAAAIANPLPLIIGAAAVATGLYVLARRRDSHRAH